jgi:hypothetical protein
VQWWQLFIGASAISLAAGFVGSFLARVFVSSLDRRQLRELQTEVAVLTSEYAKVLALSKKISNRVALDDHRQKRSGTGQSATGSPPPPGDKRAAKAYYLTGKTHQQIAREAMNGAA